jgi:hypothetical protein
MENDGLSWPTAFREVAVSRLLFTMSTSRQNFLGPGVRRKLVARMVACQADEDHVQARTLPAIPGCAADHCLGKTRRSPIGEVVDCAAIAPGGWGRINHRSITLSASSEAAGPGEALMDIRSKTTLVLDAGSARAARDILR